MQVYDHSLLHRQPPHRSVRLSDSLRAEGFFSLLSTSLPANIAAGNVRAELKPSMNDVAKTRERTSIRTQRLPTLSFHKWMQEVTRHQGGDYRHRLLREDRTHRSYILDDLRRYTEEAMNDARRVLTAGLDDSLSPFTKKPQPSSTDLGSQCQFS
jgi:hypothetical protein